MTVVVDSRDDVTLEALRRVAFEREPVQLSAAALEGISAAHASFQRYLEAHADTFVYGLTSGHGPEASRSLTLNQARTRRRASPPSWGPFGGPLLPEYVSRAAAFACLSSLVSGHAAVSAERAQAVAGLLAGPLPQLPSRGLTAAGELMPNAVLNRALPPDDALTAGWGFHTEAGMAGIAALLTRGRLRLAECVFALSIEALAAPLDAYDPVLGTLWADPHGAAALDALGSLLAGAGGKRRPFQAPVSYRIVPRLLGQAHRAAAALDDVASAALRADASNPVYLPPDTDHPLGRTLSNGGFHNADAAPALDAVSATWANLAALAHRHAVVLHRGTVSLLPDRLLPAGGGHSTSYMEYVPTGLVAEMRRLAAPTLLPGTDISASEQDDVAITTPLAFVAEREVAERFDATLAVLAVVASQALHVDGRTVAPPLAPVLAAVRDIVAPVESPRALAPECEQLAAAFSTAVDFGPSPFGGLVGQ